MHLVTVSGNCKKNPNTVGAKIFSIFCLYHNVIIKKKKILHLRDSDKNDLVAS